MLVCVFACSGTGTACKGELSAPAVSLAQAEGRIALGAAGFFASACCALLDIHDLQLYRQAGHASFAVYIRATTHLGFELRQARNWVAAARFLRGLPANVPLPTCERQVRPLAGLDRDAAVRSWLRALQRASTSGSGRVSARIVAECVRETVGQPERALSGSTGCAVQEAVGVVGGRGADARGRADVFVQSSSDEWYTPLHILNKVRELFAPGCIDLDPCSSEAANAQVGASAFFRSVDDGLSPGLEWRGNVFVNPPFGVRNGKSVQGLFFERCVTEYEQGHVAQAVILLKAGVGYKWFKPVMAWPVCFLWERLSFTRPCGDEGALEEGPQNPHGSVVVYLGPRVRDQGTVLCGTLLHFSGV